MREKRKLILGLCLVFALAVCGLFTGCGKKTGKQQDTGSVPQGGDEEETVDDGGSLQYILSDSSLTGNKMLYFDGTGMDSILRLINTETNEKASVISVTTRIMEYNEGNGYYTQSDRNTFPFLYNGRIYFVASGVGEDVYGNYGVMLWSISPEQNGSDLKGCFQFGAYTTAAYLINAIRIEEKLYVPIQYRKPELDENGWEVGLDATYFSVYEYDLSTGAGKEIFRTEEDYYGYQMCYTEGKLAVAYTKEDTSFLYGFSDEANAFWKVPNQESIISVIDLESKTAVEYTENRKLLGANNGEFLVLSSDYMTCSWFEPETGNLTEVWNTGDEDILCMVYQFDEGVVIGCGSGKSGNFKNKYYIYREGKNEPEEWTRTDEEYNFYIQCAGNEKLFITWVPARETYSEEDCKYEFADKEDFLK